MTRVPADIQAYWDGRSLMLVSALAPQLALLVVQEQLPPVVMVERLVSTHESMENGPVNGLRRVTGLSLSRADLQTAVANLTEILRRRDLPALIQALCRVVPEYQPSAGLLELLNDPLIRTHRA